MSQLRVKISPNARHSQVMGIAEGVWSIKIGAPPIEGKANTELVKFLSRLLKVGVSRVTVEKGMSSRNKLIKVEGVSDEELLLRLSEAQSKSG